MIRGTLHEDVQDWFSDPEVRKDMLSYQHVADRHWRIATVSHDVG